MYKKPEGLLLAKPIQRIAPKSSFLKKLEAMQKPKLTPEEKVFLNAGYGPLRPYQKEFLDTILDPNFKGVSFIGSGTGKVRK